MTDDQVKARGYNLDIKNPPTSEDDHGDPDELLARLNAAEAEAARLREQLKGDSEGGSVAIEVKVPFSQPELAEREAPRLIFPSFLHKLSHGGFIDAPEHQRL